MWARRQRAGPLGEEGSRRATLRPCQLRSGFLGAENSIWKVSHRKQKELQCVKAIWPHRLVPISHWGCLGGSSDRAVPGGSARVLGQHDARPAPSMWCCHFGPWLSEKLVSLQASTILLDVEFLVLNGSSDIFPTSTEQKLRIPSLGT